MKKQRVFQEGLIYVFVFKKFKKDLPTYDESPESRKCTRELRKTENGMQVVEFEKGITHLVAEQWGKLKNGTNVHIDWCKCIGKEQNK